MGGKVSKYSQAAGKVIDVVASKANLPVNPHYGQLCLVNDESRSYVYEGSEWLVLPKHVQDDRLNLVVAALRLQTEGEMISKAASARMYKEANEAKIRELEGVFPAAVPSPDEAPEAPSPQGHTDYWIGRQYTCKYCGRPRKHRVGWIFQGNNPQGDTVFFCNVDCCNGWEATLDNMNNRRGAIEATRRKRAEREKHD